MSFIYDEVAGTEVEVHNYVAPVASAPALVLCPVCKSWVQTKVANYTDELAKIVNKKTVLYGSHQKGGKRASGGFTCMGAGQEVTP